MFNVVLLLYCSVQNAVQRDLYLINPIKRLLIGLGSQNNRHMPKNPGSLAGFMMHQHA